MMFLITKRIRYNIAKGMVLSVVLGFLAWFTCLFIGFITQKQTEIDYAYESLPVSVVVSNLQGSQTDNLLITEDVIDYFISDTYYYLGQVEPVAFSSYVKDVLIKSTLYYTICTTDESLDILSDSMPENQKIVGITSTIAEPKLDATEGVEIHYFSSEGNKRFVSDVPVCIVSESLLHTMETDEDGKYRMVLQVHTSPDATEVKLLLVEIIGYYTKDDNTIYCSWNAVAEIQKLLSGEIIADSLGATIKDNRKLDDFKLLLQRHFAEVNPTGALTEIPNAPVPAYFRYAATVQDQILRQTVNNLHQNMKTLQRLLPLIVALALAIAFFAGFLYVYAQKKPLAIARSLGTPQKTVILIILLENAAWVLGGICIYLGLLTVVPMVHNKLPYVVVVNCAFMIGSWIAGYMACGKKAQYSLKEDE